MKASAACAAAVSAFAVTLASLGVDDGRAGWTSAVGVPSPRGDVDLVAQLPPEPLAIEVAYESGRVTENENSEGISIELAGTLQCNRPVTAVLSVEIVVESATAPVETVGMFDCSSVPQTWGLGLGTSDSAFAVEAPVATIVAQATDELYAAMAGGDPVVVEDRIDRAEVDPLRNPGAGGAAAPGLEWLGLIVAATAALAGWSVLVLRWARGRRRLA